MNQTAKQNKTETGQDKTNKIIKKIKQIEE